MKKFKILSFSLIAALSLGVSVQVSNVQASESSVPLITQASDQIFVSRERENRTPSSIWITETRNGKTYSGYIYYRGPHPNNGKYIFTGYLKVGPYVDQSLPDDN